MKNVPAALVPYVCVLIGIIGNLASDAASVMVPPLAAMASWVLESIRWPV